MPTIITLVSKHVVRNKRSRISNGNRIGCVNMIWYTSINVLKKQHQADICVSLLRMRVRRRWYDVRNANNSSDVMNGAINSNRQTDERKHRNIAAHLGLGRAAGAITQ